MNRRLIFLLFLLFPHLMAGQAKALQKLLADSTMDHSSVSLCIIRSENGKPVYEHNAGESNIPASVMKLVTSAAALELLGPEYRFKTRIGYSGSFIKETGLLNGDIVITGGGDPALGSVYFKDNYDDFLKKWINDIIDLGIKKIDGKIITDDSRYDYQPVPSKWLWEDAGNYYGAGAYGLSVFDNTFEIHLSTSSEGSTPVITRIAPEICRYELSNQLKASGNNDNGYVFAAPYNDYGWLSGSIPADNKDFVLKASVSDPPLLLAKIISYMLDSAGIEITEDPSTARLEKGHISNELKMIAELDSPPLKEIIGVMNHESINLFAEHLLKELGKIYSANGSTAAGIEVLYKFLKDSGINTDGMFIEDGSGMSPMDAVTSRNLTDILLFMQTKGKYFNEFYNSLPEAGKEGTLKYYFRDPVFDLNLKAKSGSMTRVRSYAGYIKTYSGKNLIFSIIINNFTGPSNKIVSGIEEIIKETIQDN